MGATRFASPIGELVITASDSGLTGVWFPGNVPVAAARRDDEPGPASAVLARVAEQLAEYFAGTRTTFDVPLDAGGTPFERRVWDALRTIPYGTTLSYGELARRLGDVRATRAVGAANGKNPIPIIVPCHRVIGANGALTGFGGGLDRKRWLLEHEGALMMLGG
jgi:methylated-DNA-[protein]-cysteine S-methyltransferase